MGQNVLNKNKELDSLAPGRHRLRSNTSSFARPKPVHRLIRGARVTHARIAHPLSPIGTVPEHIDGIRRTPWSEPSPCAACQAVLLYVPRSAENSSFLKVLRSRLPGILGADVYVVVEPRPGHCNRCRYRLYGSWPKPVAVHDTLVHLFSVFQSEPTDDPLP